MTEGRAGGTIHIVACKRGAATRLCRAGAVVFQPVVMVWYVRQRMCGLPVVRLTAMCLWNQAFVAENVASFCGGSHVCDG